jgi:hypothetical protein
MKRFMNKRVAVVGAVAGLVLGLSGAAFAYWTSSGGGNGSATTATAGNSNVSVTGSEASPATMGPNIAPEAITLTITNPSTNSQSSYVTSVTASIDSTDTTWNVGPPDCAATDYQLQASSSDALSAAGTANGTQSVTVPVGAELAPGGQTTATVYIGFVDDTTNQTACEGQSVDLTYTTA